MEPNAPDLLNNLATALLAQGREDECHALVRDIQRRFPDYFFGRIALAHEQIAEDDLEAAKRTLGELTQRNRFHISEYAAMGECYIRIAVEMGDVDQAWAWLQRIEDVYPDYHALGKLRRVVALLGGKKAFSEFTKKQRFLRGNRASKRSPD